MDLRYPQMRKELIEHIQSLSDPEYQKRCWVQRNCPENIVYDGLGNVVHFFYDDTSLSDDPDGNIGWFLVSKDESSAVSEIISSIDHVFAAHGENLKDEEYLFTKEWVNVVENAKRALVVFAKSGKP